MKLLYETMQTVHSPEAKGSPLQISHRAPDVHTEETLPPFMDGPALPERRLSHRDTYL